MPSSGPTSGNDPEQIVGRDHELARLEAALARLDAGSSLIVEVVGEPGIGKSTMLAALTRSASGTLVLSGRGAEFERDVAFGVFADAIDHHLAAASPQRARRLLEEDGPELAAVFPALRAHARVADMSPLATERFRRHRAVRALLERLAATEPVVLILDDVHWADPASIELIGALVRKPPAARVLLALAYRPRQAPARLVADLDAAARDGVIDRIDVGPLAAAEAERLLAGTVGERDRAAIFADSGGNPFYLHQLARARKHAGTAAPAAGADLGVPATVAAALFEELAPISAAGRAFAQAAAVAGEPFDPDLAAEVAELVGADALAALDELIDADLVRATGVPRSFAFRHPLVRRAVYEAARPGWRLAAHGRADAALAGRGAAATERAHHIEQAARPGDADAVALLSAAARQAAAPATSARWLAAAVRLTPAEAPARLDLLQQLARALGLAGRLEEGRGAALEALALLPAGDGDARRIELVVFCAGLERLLGRHDEARTRLAAAQAALADPGSRAGVALAIEQVAGALFTGASKGLGATALAMFDGAQRLGDPALLGAATAVMTAIAFHGGNVDAARAHTDAAAQYATRLADAAPAIQLDLLFHLGFTEIYLGRYADARTHLDRSVAVARTTGAGHYYVEAMAGAAVADGQRGRLAAAREAVEAAVEAARLATNQQKLAWALAARCTVARQAGDLETALRDGGEAAELARTIETSIVSAGVGRAVADALVEAGEHAAAVAVMLELQGGPGLAMAFPTTQPLVYETLVRAELGRGDHAAASDWARRAVRRAEALDLALPRAMAALAEAHVLLAAGDAGGAAARALESARLADSTDARIDAARARIVAGRALTGAGQREGAGELLRQAESDATAYGAQRLRQECVRELRRIGRRVTQARKRGGQAAGGIESLSGREREVAELVRDRLTNKEIAEQLFLSQKTIESHLRNVFVKLGVDSRVAVARALERAGG